MNQEDKHIIKLLIALLFNLLALSVAWQLKHSKCWLNRRWLIAPINRMRKSMGYFVNTFQEIKKDEKLFFRVTRMTVESFNYLTLNLTPYLTKYRSNISVEERLAIPLRYLSTGDSILSIAIEYRIGESTCYNIVRETCSVLFDILSPTYLQIPSKEQWKNIADGFLRDWNLPNCCGAIDGKHVQIKAPSHSGSGYFNYKKSYSIILLAVCDHNYQFRLFDVGAMGSESDGGVFARSELGKAMRENRLNFPLEKNKLPGSNIEMPYYLIGDDAFEMSSHLMKPYSGRYLEEKQNICNYRFSRARRVVENSFGILTSRWRFLSKPIGMNPSVVIKCVLAAISLHNFLMSPMNSSRNMYCSPGLIDEEIIENNKIISGSWRNHYNSLEDINEIHIDEPMLSARIMRDTLSDYFLTPEGEVPWQYSYVNKGFYNK